MAPVGRRFSLGVDFGTNSVRALVVDIADGAEIATSVYRYPSGEAGILLDARDPNVARQNPADYIEGFHRAVRGAVRKAAGIRGFDRTRVVGLGIDTTGSTPIPVDRGGVPLALHRGFSRQPAAHAWLWKDHTAHAEAAEITAAAGAHAGGYLTKCGGTYSSEWYWSKILHCRRTAPKVFEAAYGWVELADFMPAYATNRLDPDTMPRGICAAGHKAMYHDAWGGLPDARFLTSLDPGLAVLRQRFATPALPSDRVAGMLSAHVARRVGLPTGVPVAVGILDAHAGAVGAGIKPGTLTKIIGTSTCDMMVAPLESPLPDIPGLCGIVPSSIVPGMYGLEAGQSAVGDIFNWFASSLAPARHTTARDPHASLTKEAARLMPGASGLLALDWNNGNRTILVDPRLTGLLVGQTLQTTAAEIYRALIEATAFGALTIIDRLEAYGVRVREVVNCGGIAEHNPFVMQVYADVCNRPMAISRSAQTPALGAAIFGAVAGGGHRSVEGAQRRMTGVKPTAFRPRRAAAAVYAELYPLYTDLHDAFGRTERPVPLAHVMKRLIELRDRVRRGRRA
jgi:L-ribulokinase